MDKLIVAPVVTAAEFEEAYALALAVFTENSAMNGYGEYKLYNWTADPSFKYDNILLARYQGEPAGLIRIVPRVIYRGDVSFAVAGISSVCLLPSSRGQGLSIPLMEQSLAYCTQRGFDMAFLFARRAADRYYTQFGFHGIASYAHILVNKTQSEEKLAVSFSEIDPSLCHLYNEAYTYAYRSCFGRMERTEAYWQYIIKSTSWRKEFRFFTIKLDGVAIGYLIAGDYKIFEIATNTDIPGNELIHLILSNEIVKPVNDKLEIEILPQHRLLNFLQGTDMTLQTRECAYGGRMAKILNVDSVYNKMKKSAMLPGREYGSIKEKTNLSYPDTCTLLGVLSLTCPYQEGALPFDIGSIDHF